MTNIPVVYKNEITFIIEMILKWNIMECLKDILLSSLVFFSQQLLYLFKIPV